jgi:hypothetical protein
LPKTTENWSEVTLKNLKSFRPEYCFHAPVIFGIFILGKIIFVGKTKIYLILFSFYSLEQHGMTKDDANQSNQLAFPCSVYIDINITV